MTMPVFYLSHGGGPWPWMEERRESHADLARSLAELPSQLPHVPTAILMISAHWESKGGFLVQSHPNPPMLYDYYNFPTHTYQVQYPAAGHPELAQHVQELLAADGFNVALDAERGFDHGAFVTGFAMWPHAEIPIVQLSIEQGYDPELHLALGQSLRPLREQGVLIIGSGASYHNLRLMGPEGAPVSVAFDDWLEQAMLAPRYENRAKHIINWANAPGARTAHAREDHLVPLFVAVGASTDSDTPQRTLDSTSATGIRTASYRFG